MKAAIALCLLLVGCSAEKAPVQAQRLDPSWPDSVQTFQGDWKVIDVNGSLYVGLPYNQFQGFTGFLGDVKRYTKDTHDVLCYYRNHLKEPTCEVKNVGMGTEGQ